MLFGACSSTVKNQNPLQKPFPQVEGTSLDNKKYKLPADVKGKPVLLLIGYKQESQFDIDRWLLGLMQAKTKIKTYEIPTIKGIFPGMIAGTIDEGMRRGIPREDWAVVITIYNDADKIVNFLGNEKPNNTRVVLLDKNGLVIWFHDRGYSASKLLELDKQIKQL